MLPNECELKDWFAQLVLVNTELLRIHVFDALERTNFKYLDNSHLFCFSCFTVSSF